jgi:hypothetical protein
MKKCPAECDYTTYDITVTNSAYPSSSYSDVLYSLKEDSNNMFMSEIPSTSDFKKDSLKESVLSMNVYYQSSTFMRINEKPRSIMIYFLNFIFLFSKSYSFLK